MVAPLPLVVPPPLSEGALLAACGRIAGATLGELGRALGVAVPAEPRRAKGFAGQLVERALGAAAGSRAVPDFEGLGIELKTLPVSLAGKPRESTFVSTLDLSDPATHRWGRSAVRHKLMRVLWVPIEADDAIPIASRRVGTGRLWSPSLAEEAGLREDFEQLVELIAEGFADQVTGRTGKWLQLRPKGRDSSHLRWALDDEGGWVKAQGKAFYLRASFTHELVRRYWA